MAACCHAIARKQHHGGTLRLTQGDQARRATRCDTEGGCHDCGVCSRAIHLTPEIRCPLLRQPLLRLALPLGFFLLTQRHVRSLRQPVGPR